MLNDGIGQRGYPKGLPRFHTRHPSWVTQRLKRAGVDWPTDLANAIKTNNETRISMWLKLLPYLFTMPYGKPRAKRKGKVSKLALAALDALEGQ